MFQAQDRVTVVDSFMQEVDIAWSVRTRARRDDKFIGRVGFFRTVILHYRDRVRIDKTCSTEQQRAVIAVVKPLTKASLFIDDRFRMA